MLNFGKFLESLLEARAKKAPKEKEFNLNDAKGKLYEILAGSHLQHGTHKTGRPNSMITHYRDEEGKSPQDVHDYIKKELEARQPGLYKEINQHAIEGASHIRDQLAAHGHTNIGDTAWTSQPGDHNKFTGEDDPNSDADIMVKGNNGPVGLSLKYGKTKDMNLRNPGLETLEKAGGLKPGALDELRKEHQRNLEFFDIQGHDHYKQLKASSNPAERAQADAANKSALETQRKMAKMVADGLSARAEKDPEFLRNHVKSTIAPQTTFQHFRLHTRPDGKGGATHHLSDMQDDASKLDDFEDFRVVPHDGTTISYRIEGRRKGKREDGSDHPYEPVLDQGIKKGSGPTKGFAGMTKAPFLTRKDKGKALVTPPPKPRTKSTPVKPAPAEDPRIAAMSTDGGREPPERIVANSTHSGKNFYAPHELQK